jgi:acyl-CoA thioester hydrolase
VTEALSHVPFSSYRAGVDPSSIDYNGHLNDAAYAQVLTDANEEFLDALGLSATYRERTGCAMYTVEITLKFMQEVSAEDQLRAESILATHDAKRVRVHTTLFKGNDVQVATGDSLYLHVDTASGRVSTFPDDRAGVLDDVQRAHDEASTSR